MHRTGPDQSGPVRSSGNPDSHNDRTTPSHYYTTPPPLPPHSTTLPHGTTPPHTTTRSGLVRSGHLTPTTRHITGGSGPDRGGPGHVCKFTSKFRVAIFDHFIVLRKLLVPPSAHQAMLKTNITIIGTKSVHHAQNSSSSRPSSKESESLFCLDKMHLKQEEMRDLTRLTASTGGDLTSTPRHIPQEHLPRLAGAALSTGIRVVSTHLSCNCSRVVV